MAKKTDNKKAPAKVTPSRRKFRPASWWRVLDGKIWVQVSISDHVNRDPLKRSRRARKVADLIHSDALSNEEIFETSEEVLKDLGLKIPQLSERAKGAPAKQSPVRKKRVPIDKEAIAQAALKQTSAFKASEILPGSNIPIGTIRVVLGALVKEGKLKSIPKKGYEPAQKS